MENFYKPPEKKNKNNRNRIANSLANPTETLRTPSYPPRPDPTVRSSPSSSLSGTAGPQLSKVVVYDNGPTTVWFGRGDDVSEKAKMCLRFLGGKQKMRNSKVIIKKKSKTKTEKNTAKNGILFVSDRAGRTI